MRREWFAIGSKSWTNPGLSISYLHTGLGFEFSYLRAATDTPSIPCTSFQSSPCLLKALSLR